MHISPETDGAVNANEDLEDAPALVRATMLGKLTAVQAAVVMVVAQKRGDEEMECQPCGSRQFE